MQHQYYIDINGAKDGPHDLVTLMRRIRAHKVDMNTLIFVDDAPTPLPAHAIEDLRMFFSKTDESRPLSSSTTPVFTLQSILREGVRFMFENNVLTVFSGAITLICLLSAIVMFRLWGPFLGSMPSWSLFIVLHYLYSVFCLRVFRGQPVSTEYANYTVSPALPPLVLAGLCIAFMMIGGFVLLIFPAVLVAVYYSFVPFFIIDRRMSVVEAMLASRLLVRKFDQRYFGILFTLITAYAGSLILIFPVPLTMPIFCAALIRIYEELSAG